MKIQKEVVNNEEKVEEIVKKKSEEKFKIPQEEEEKVAPRLLIEEEKGPSSVNKSCENPSTSPKCNKEQILIEEEITKDQASSTSKLRSSSTLL